MRSWIPPYISGAAPYFDYKVYFFVLLPTQLGEALAIPQKTRQIPNKCLLFNKIYLLMVLINPSFTVCCNHLFRV